MEWGDKHTSGPGDDPLGLVYLGVVDGNKLGASTVSSYSLTRDNRPQLVEWPTILHLLHSRETET